MITIEDANNEQYYINPVNVVYVKRRDNFWKISLSTGEAIMTKNKAHCYAAKILSYEHEHSKEKISQSARLF